MLIGATIYGPVCVNKEAHTHTKDCSPLSTATCSGRSVPDALSYKSQPYRIFSSVGSVPSPECVKDGSQSLSATFPPALRGEDVRSPQSWGLVPHFFVVAHDNQRGGQDAGTSFKLNLGTVTGALSLPHAELRSQAARPSICFLGLLQLLMRKKKSVRYLFAIMCKNKCLCVCYRIVSLCLPAE